LRVDKKVNMEVVFSRRKPAMYKVKVQKTIGKKVALGRVTAMTLKPIAEFV
jgi:hypothetical protein